MVVKKGSECRPAYGAMKYITLIFLVIIGTSSYAQKEQVPNIYKQFFRHHECSQAAFGLAWQGYHKLVREKVVKSPRYLTIIDYARPSNKRRLFVLDVYRKRLVLSSIVAHGIGSDPDSSTVPYRFSNGDGSHMSSIGFYLTGDVYTNHRPLDSLGLCLFGLDKGFNDSAAAREIVMHYGATEYTGKVYVTDSGAARSYGCPALPLSTNTRVIQLIKGGSLLFAYSNKARLYAKHSAVLNGQVQFPIVQQGPPPNNCTCNIQR